jgi:lipid-A-disaccharide synthase
MVVAYRVNPLSAAIARRLVTVRHAALVNLLAAPPPSTSLSQGDGEVVVPELIQQDCTPDRLAAALGPLLTDPARAEAQRAGFFRIINALQPESGLLPSEAAAQEVLAAIEQA